MTDAQRSRSPMRAAMWLLVGLATYWLYTAIRAAQQGESGMLGLSLALSGISLTVAGLIGVRAARQRLKNQAVSAAQAAQMMLIAQLGQQDDATLERLTRSGGASAESARMILQGRHLGNPAGRTRPHTSELE